MVAAPFISKKDIQIVFGPVENLEQLTAQLLEELERAKDTVGSVGNAFLRTVPRISPDYIEYAANYDRSQERIDMLKQNEEYTRFIRQCVQRQKGTLELNNYLIMPVQRPPRYRLLLETVLKHTKEKDPDYRILHEAMELCSRFNDEINAYKRDQDNRWKFAEIKRRTLDFPDDLYEPQRYFIKEGALEFAAPRRKSLFTLKTSSSEKCYFFLFTDVLVRAKFSRKQQPEQFEYADHLMLAGCLCEEVTSGEGSCLRITMKGKPDEELLLFTSDESTHKQWVTELQQAIQVLEVNALCT